MTRPRMPKMRANQTPPTAFAAIAALALSVLLTWPVVLFPTELLLGHPGNDTWNHVWGYWWVSETLSQGAWPAWTNLLSYPEGGTLYFIDTVQAVLVTPIYMLVGPAMAFNLVIIFGFALSAWGAWLLAYRLTGDAVSSGIAMVIYGASPHLLGQAYNGISETMCAGWLPIALWSLLYFLDRPNWRRAVGLGAAMAITMLTSWYYGLFAIFATAVVLIWRAVHQPWIQPWVRSLIRLTGASVIGILLVGPALLLFQSSLRSEERASVR